MTTDLAGSITCDRAADRITVPGTSRRTPTADRPSPWSANASGAMAGVSTEATAFAHRRSRILVNVAAMYGQPDEAHEPWVTDFAAALRQGDRGAYVGLLGVEGSARIREAYPGATWEQLAAVKRRYDPTNLFHLNENVPPA